MKKSNVVFKIFIAIVVVLLLIFLINTIRKVIILTSIENAVYEKLQKENYYWNLKIDNTEISTYRKGEKALMKLQTENGDFIFFQNGYLLNTYNEIEKIAILNEKKELSNINIPYAIQPNNMFLTIFSTFNSRIKSLTIDGVEYYFIESSSDIFITHSSVNKVQLLVEKETGLVLKMIEFLDSGKVTTTTYMYEFDTVTDEYLKEPDISNYQIKK